MMGVADRPLAQRPHEMAVPAASQAMAYAAPRLASPMAAHHAGHPQSLVAPVPRPAISGSLSVPTSPFTPSASFEKAIARPTAPRDLWENGAGIECIVASPAGWSITLRTES